MDNIDNNICEVVTSLRGGIKINVNGYLMVKDKSRDNKYYWCCEKRNALGCNGRATTILDGEQHYLLTITMLQKPTDLIS